MSKEFKHHFFPHIQNRTRASLLSLTALAVYCLMLLVLPIAVSFSAGLMPGVLGYASDIHVRELLYETNKIREQQGLKPLVLNAALVEAAQQKATHMFLNDYWSHVSPDGTEPWSFILAENYDYSYAGENLAKNFNTSKDVVAAWYKSPTHRDNLLSENYDEVGFAVVDGVLEGYDTTLVVQMFGRPRDLSLLTTPEQEASILENLDKTVATVDAGHKGGSSSSKPVSSPQQSIWINIHTAYKYMTVLFVTFILVLLSVDIWYSKRHSIPKFTGHTLAHLVFLVMVLISLLFLVQPGNIL